MFAGAALLVALARLPGAAPPAPLPSEIARWVEELGDDSFAVREAASRKLHAAGARAEPALLKALDSKDAEVVKRAKAILAQFKWGIYPDTPPRVAELIGSYRSAARSERRAVVRKLLDAGPDGHKALAKIALAEDDAQVRREVFAEVTAGLPGAAQAPLEENNRSAVEALLELALASDTRSGVRHYTAYHLLTGQLPARVAEWEGRAKAAVVPKTENAVLAYLHRAGGDWPRARAAAAAAERADLLEGFLYEQADWKELARTRRFPPTEDTVRYLAYRAAYGRLGGDKKVYDDAVADLVKTGRRLAENKNNVFPYATALFLNGRATEAIELLTKSGTSPKMLFEVLAAQGRIQEAVAVVEAARQAGSGELPILEILEARLLHGLGDKERALAALAKYAREVHRGAALPPDLELLDAELHLGRRDQAFAHAAKMLDLAADGVASAVVKKLYEEKGEDARVLWNLLKGQRPRDEAADRLASLRRLLDGAAPEQEAKAFFDAAKIDKRLKSGEELRVLGEVAVACKRPDDAEHFFRAAGTCRAAIRLGDLLAQKKQWQQAAAQYQAAYKLGLKAKPGRADEGEGLPALALWLSGHALVQAGQAAEGKLRMERAHLLPLGDGEMRFELSRVLRRRGHREAAAREQELLRRVGEPALSEMDSYFTGEGFRAAAIEATDRKDYLKAADGYEQTFLRCLQPGMNFARAAAYVTVPGFISVLRARGLAAAGRLDEAVAEGERARASQPGSVDLAMHLVPELERRGRKKEADALYAAVVGHHEAVVRDWPKCAWARNQLAWLAACCRRDLERGLEQARKAVELSPETAGYHDTLAEVLFQLGRNAEAAAAEKKAVALAPARAYYKKQLKRIEAGDPKAARPDEEE
jgi:tetratricopeptide (TPR) repeat protein